MLGWHLTQKNLECLSPLYKSWLYSFPHFWLLFLIFLSPGFHLLNFVWFFSPLSPDTIALFGLDFGSLLGCFWTLLLDLFLSALLIYLTKSVPTSANYAFEVYWSPCRVDGTLLHLARLSGVDSRLHGGPNDHSSAHASWTMGVGWTIPYLCPIFHGLIPAPISPSGIFRLMLHWTLCLVLCSRLNYKKGFSVFQLYSGRVFFLRVGREGLDQDTQVSREVNDLMLH